MFEYLQFDLCGMAFIEIRQNSGSLSCRYRIIRELNDFYKEPQWICVPSNSSNNLRIWIKRLENLQIYRWSSDYVYALASDGVQWQLQYKDTNKMFRKRIKGSNLYPDAWNSLMTLLSEFNSEIDFLRFCKPVVQRKHIFRKAFTYGKLKEAMEKTYLDTGLEPFTNFGQSCTGINPELFKDAISYLTALGLDLPADRDELYSKLFSMGYRADHLQDIEWCFPADERDLQKLEKQYA